MRLATAAGRGIMLDMRAILLPLVIAFAAARPAAAADDSKSLEFFEKKIRPLLAEHCLACHSADAQKNKKLKGGLFLDTRDGWKTGGDSGPAIVPGKPGESLFIESIRYDGDLKMPPKGKLPAAAIADFEQWVKLGAPDPRTTALAKKQVGLSIEEGRKFWSYKPVAKPLVPAVKDEAWIANDIDRFILSKLESNGLKPAKDADRLTLARRLYFDLHGLPPTPEEADAFANDPDPKAYEKLVDRLLASPRFGERWGRHWLDVARFGESITLRGSVFKEAWRYRDWVIDSFNRDMPIDAFIKDQLAGDLRPSRNIVATTYLQLGNHNLEEQDKKQLRMDVVDEQLDAISKGFLAQTVTCARCHDHKFDPIPTADYYALAGILRNVRALKDANVSEWIEVPLPAPPAVEAAVKKHDAQVAALQEKVKAAKAKAPGASGTLAIKDVPGIVVDDADAKKVGEWMNSTSNATYIGAGYTHDKNERKGEKSITFDPDIATTGKYEVWFAYSPGANRAAKVPVKVFSAEGEKDFTIDMTKTPPVQGRYISLGQFRFEKDGQSFVLVSNEGTMGHVCVDAVAFIPADKVPEAKPTAKGGDNAAALEAELKKLQAGAPKRPLAMSVIEESKIEDTAIRIRGIVHNLGEIAPRGVLKVATPGATPAMPKDQSGRLQLADWIASRENPLTARVYANRTWHWLFGSGIVRTVDNFGTTGETPSHPELLDHLATQFATDWSTKNLVRSIVLSRTYRQASTPNARDPENRLFGRANKRRLEAEAIRDAMLVVGGTMTEERGGPQFPATIAADYGYKHTATTRSVYLPVFRNAIPELFDVFDFADPSAVTGRRNASTVAPQALFMLNNPFAVESAKKAAARLLAEDLSNDTARLDRAYRMTLGRAPTAGERTVAEAFLEKNPGAWPAVFQSLFASADFRFVE